MSVNLGDNLKFPMADTRVKLDSAEQSAHKVIDALKNLKVSGDYPTAKREAIDAIGDLSVYVNDTLASDFTSLYERFATGVLGTFEGFTDGEYPITEEGLADLNAYLSTDTLEQFKYLDVHNLCKAVSTLTTSAQLAIDANAFLLVSPEDMNARSVLTRTILYVERLKLADNLPFFTKLFDPARMAAEGITTYAIHKLNEVRDAIADDFFDEAKIKAISNPNLEEQIAAIITKMEENIKSVISAVSDARAVCDYFENLGDAVGETHRAIVAAYLLYIDTQKIKF